MSYYATRPETTDDLKQSELRMTGNTILSAETRNITAVPSLGRHIMQAIEVAECYPQKVTITDDFSVTTVKTIPDQDELDSMLRSQQRSFDSETDRINQFRDGETLETLQILTVVQALRERVKADPDLQELLDQAEILWSSRK